MRNSAPPAHSYFYAITTTVPVTSLADLDPNGTYSYADYLSWKFEEVAELIRGKVLRRMSAPTDLHQATVGEVYFAFRT